MHALLLAVLVTTQTGAGREADMFGSDEPAPSPASGPESATPTDTLPQNQSEGSARDDDIFGNTSTPETLTPGLATSSGILQDADNALALGGQLFLRLNANYREGGGIGDGTLAGPSLIDAFADVRPVDRIRAYAQLRFSFDYTVEDGEQNAFGQALVPFDIQLAQAWAKFDLGQVAYITAGRQRIRWGTGRFWNPTDFVNQEIRNSIDFFDQRVGVDLVKVHFPFEQLGWNLYLITTFNGVDLASDTGLAARAEFVFGEAELALSSAVRKDAPLRFGADVSAGVWLFDVRGEAVVSRGLGRPLFKGELDFAQGVFPEEVDPEDDDWWFQGVVGAEATVKYSDTDTFSVGAEYFYNQAGYASAELYPFLFLNRAFVPLYTGQHYAGVYAFAASPFDFKDLTVTASTLGNLSDLSFLSRLDFQYTILQYLTVNTFVAAHLGNVGELKLGLEVDPVPVVLPNGFVLQNDRLDVGVALRVKF